MPDETQTPTLVRRFRLQPRRLLRQSIPYLIGALAILLGLLLYDRFVAPPDPPTTAEIDARVEEGLAAVTPAPPYSATAYDVILPSLVVVRTHGLPRRDGGQTHAPLLDRAPAGFQLIADRSQVYPAQTDDGPVDIGGGVVISNGGLILTAFHVVEYAAAIDVIFADGSETTAAIVAVEPDIDIAVLQPAQLPEVFAPATLGNPGALRIGDEVFAVGNPLGLAGSISAGVVSGLDRTYRPPGHNLNLERLIQYDAAVNPGSPGGPLLNRNGEVVGIVVGAVNPGADETFIGIGFAVRIDVAGGAAGAPEQ